MRRLALLLAPLLATTAGALAGDPWDATWVGGFDAGNGVQLIVVSDSAIALDWRDDYVLGLQSTMSGDGNAMDLTWEGGSATVTKIDDDHARIVVHGSGKPDVSVDLTPDG